MIWGKPAVTIPRSAKYRLLLAACTIITLSLLLLLDAAVVSGTHQFEFAGKDKRVADLLYDSIDRIDISPLVPAVGDVLTITISGEWHDACVPEYQSHQIVGNVISIGAAANPAYLCIQIPTSWEFSVEITPSLAGVYIVKVYIPYSSPPFLTKNASFFVIPASPISTVLSIGGGELVHRYPGHVTSLVVPPGALSTPSTFTISYHMPPPTVGHLQGMDHFFILTSTQTQFAVPLTVTVHYSGGVRGAIISGTENLYRWQNGQWVTEAITPTNRWSEGLSAQITHLSLFGVLGETNRTYLPIVLK